MTRRRRTAAAVLALPLLLAACTGGGDDAAPEASYPAPPASSVVTVGEPVWSARDLELVDASDTAVLVASSENYPDGTGVYHRLVVRSPGDGAALLDLDDRYPDDLASRTAHDSPRVLQALVGDAEGGPVVMPYQSVECDVALGTCPYGDRRFSYGVLAVALDGTEAWRWLPPARSLPPASTVVPVGVLDGVVVAQGGPRAGFDVGPSRRVTTWGLDAASGAVLWSEQGRYAPVGDVLAGVRGGGRLEQRAVVLDPTDGSTTWTGEPGTEVEAAAGSWLVLDRAVAADGTAGVVSELVDRGSGSDAEPVRELAGGPVVGTASSAGSLLAWVGPSPGAADGEELLWTLGPDDDEPTAVPLPVPEGADDTGERLGVTAAAGDHVVLSDGRRSWVVGRDGTVQSEPLDGRVEHLGAGFVLTVAGERGERTLRPLTYS